MAEAHAGIAAAAAPPWLPPAPPGEPDAGGAFGATLPESPGDRRGASASSRLLCWRLLPWLPSERRWRSFLGQVWLGGGVVWGGWPVGLFSTHCYEELEISHVLLFHCCVASFSSTSISRS